MQQGCRRGSSLLTLRTPLRLTLRLLGLVLQHDVLAQPGLLVGRQQVRASQKLPELRRQDDGLRLGLLSGCSLALTYEPHTDSRRNDLADMLLGNRNVIVCGL